MGNTRGIARIEMAASERGRAEPNELTFPEVAAHKTIARSNLDNITQIIVVFDDSICHDLSPGAQNRSKSRKTRPRSAKSDLTLPGGYSRKLQLRLAGISE
jgi:hypothetical protein